MYVLIVNLISILTGTFCLCTAIVIYKNEKNNVICDNWLKVYGKLNTDIRKTVYATSDIRALRWWEFDLECYYVSKNIFL